MAKFFDTEKLKSGLTSSLKDAVLGQRLKYDMQLHSYQYCQLELEYAYKKAGGFQNCLEKDSIRLVDEPQNEYDPQAIAVYAFNVKVGYIPSELTELVRGLKKKESFSIRFYFYEDFYRGELTIIYRDK